MSEKESFNFHRSSLTRKTARRQLQDREADFAFASKSKKAPSQLSDQDNNFLRSEKKLSEQSQSPEEVSSNASIQPKVSLRDSSLSSHHLEIAAATKTAAQVPNSAVKSKTQKAENWLLRRGHSATFALLFLFTLVLYFRPYELFPQLSAFSSVAWYLAIGTILVFIPSQLVAENSLTARPPEVNYILLLAVFGVITIPIARDPALAWQEFNDPFLKVVFIFIVMVNVIRTEKRLKAMMWLALAVGVMLAVSGIQNYANGNFSVEGYRAMADMKGMFGNPNTQALHLVTITPIAITLGLATRNFLLRLLYFALAALFIAGNMVTFSRGGFLGLILAALIMAWKLGRRNRLQVITVCAVVGIVFIALAPGGYGVRLLSIFIPGLDPVGSSDQRKELLLTSLIVSLRNPWGIGMGNFTLANPFNLVTHNSYTQVSSEMGILAFAVYCLLHYTPLKHLLQLEKELEDQPRDERSWIRYLAIGLQASFAGWCVASFFDAAAYQWFLYYLVAYAICLRRVYQISQQSTVISQQQLVAVS